MRSIVLVFHSLLYQLTFYKVNDHFYMMEKVYKYYFRLTELLHMDTYLCYTIWIFLQGMHHNCLSTVLYITYYMFSYYICMMGIKPGICGPSWVDYVLTIINICISSDYSILCVLMFNFHSMVTC